MLTLQTTFPPHHNPTYQSIPTFQRYAFAWNLFLYRRLLDLT